MNNKIFTILSLFLVLCSCNKKLEIPPENTLVEKEVFKTASGAEQALSEAYFNFLDAETNYFSINYGDFTTPLLEKSTGSLTYDLGEATPTDYYVVQTWQQLFKAINSANNVIVKLPLYAQFDQQIQKQFIAEARFVRAFGYLQLLCLYGDGALSGNMSGLGLPLQLTPFEGYNTGEIIPRNTNGEVYAQIIKDLTEAINDLPIRQKDELKTRTRATRGTAYALLSRVYLYMGDFQNAAKSAEEVIKSEPSVYSLTQNLRTLFPYNPNGNAQSFTPEVIFGLPVSQMVSNSTSLDNGLGGSYFFKRSYWISHSFLNEFDPNDLRLTQLIWKGDSVYNPNMFGEKTTFKYNNSFGRDNVPMIRYAEILLTRAEAITRISGINDEAVELLNKVRKRSLPSSADFTVNDFADKEALINEILKQRKFELAFEGLYRYDLIRNNLPIHNPDIPENRKVLPIPQIEIDISKNLITQNPGYTK